MRKQQDFKWRKEIENEAQPEGINYNRGIQTLENNLKFVEKKKNFT